MKSGLAGKGEAVKPEKTVIGHVYDLNPIPEIKHEVALRHVPLRAFTTPEREQGGYQHVVSRYGQYIHERCNFYLPTHPCKRCQGDLRTPG